MSLDGRTAMASGESQWITSEQARVDVHRMRAESCALVTGINTVLADDPLLNARVDFDVVQPVRVVLDSELKTPLNTRLLSATGRCLILTCADQPEKAARLQDAGFEVYRCAEKNGRLNLQAVMTYLASQQINEVLVEAGSVLNGALLEEDLIDEAIIYMASSIMGDQGRGLFHLPQLTKMSDRKILILRDVRQIGRDLKLTLTRD
jgi:diaminohydroxyphosphoribosylaminopyrimidine deaminase/5-amino-6-(5-phosphoribosylamino)uracil reductase